MKLIVPYVGNMLRWETRLATDVVPEMVMRYRLPDRTYGYSRLVTLWWGSRDSWAICEQDVVPTPYQLAGLEQCPKGWCCHNYENGTLPHFGLVRFRPEFRQEFSDAIGCLTDGNGWWCPYRRTATLLSETLTQAGAVCHVHEPPVTHLGPLKEKKSRRLSQS